nr:hypothetical protein [Thermaceae bacterium]
MRLYSRVAPVVLLSLAGWLAACGSDTAGSQTKQPLRITINLPPAYIGEPYSSTITADGGIRPYKYTFDGILPKGLTYADGRISGTPQEKGNFDLSVTVEDGNLSSRVQKATLSVGDTPPPQLEQVFPLAESADPFIYLLRVRNRETKGFQMQISFKDLKPTLDTLKVADGLLYVMRYNLDTRLMDIDAAFTTPKKDVEMLRLTLTPDKSLRPAFNNSNPLLAFYDKNGNLVANNPQIDRVASEGKYKFSDLVAIANNWGRKVGAPPASQTAPQGAASAQAPSNTSAQPGPTPAQTSQPQGQPGQPQTATPAQAPATPSTPSANPQEQNAGQPQAPGTPAAQPEQGSTQPGQATPTQPGQATPTQPGQATPTQ